MPQIVLDAAKTSQTVDTITIPLLDPKLRAFGFVPDIDGLLPGDLILYAQTDAIAKAIQRAQVAAGFAEADAQWSHAAVYLDQGYIAEAIPFGGVRQSSIYSVPDGLLRFRRLSGLSDIDRYRIALRALSKLGRPYSVGGIPKLGLRMFTGLWRRHATPDQKGIVICSQVYHDSVVEITRTFLQQCPVDAPVTPAHLSCSPSMTDISVGWRRLA
jgi:hypothetical protein